MLKDVLPTWPLVIVTDPVYADVALKRVLNGIVPPVPPPAVFTTRMARSLMPAEVSWTQPVGAAA